MTELLAHWQPTVIKGNAAEIGALAELSEVASRGVDSVGKGFKDPGAVVKALARERNAIVVLTGPEDYLSDGETVLKTSNGHELVSSSSAALTLAWRNHRLGLYDRHAGCDVLRRGAISPLARPRGV